MASSCYHLLQHNSLTLFHISPFQNQNSAFFDLKLHSYVHTNVIIVVGIIIIIIIIIVITVDVITVMMITIITMTMSIIIVMILMLKMVKMMVMMMIIELRTYPCRARYPLPSVQMLCLDPLQTNKYMLVVQN